MIAPCHSLQPNGLHLISPCHHHHYHHHIDQRNGYDAFENYDQYGDARDEADDDSGDGISATNRILLFVLFSKCDRRQSKEYAPLSVVIISTNSIIIIIIKVIIFLIMISIEWHMYKLPLVIFIIAIINIIIFIIVNYDDVDDDDLV